MAEPFEELGPAFAVLGFGLAWVGHACMWTAVLSHLYGRPISKRFLKLWRYLSGLIIVAFPVLWFEIPVTLSDPESFAAVGYGAVCLVIGGLVFPAVTVRRLLRKPPACVLAQSTRTLDFWPELGPAALGDGHLALAARVPGNGAFRLDVTEITLSFPDLPREWEELTILVVSDFHFHGTPGRGYFERVIDELAARPADVVCLVGDFVDTRTHHEWIQPLLRRLGGTEARLAILGNHDLYHDPARVRAELADAGYLVLGNGWRALSIRGVRCLAVGHEGPWFAPGPDLGAAPTGLFRLCLSHTPDNFYWGIDNRMRLMLCGHVHGGAIRLPVIGSIFVPSIFGRRFDCGVFEESGTMMVVSRGLSGREPIRYRCNPEAMRLTLVKRV